MMQRRIDSFFFATLIGSLFFYASYVLAQGGPDPKSFAAAANKQVATDLKTQYGFSDSQVSNYFAKREAIFNAWRSGLDASRKQMLATKNRDEKRRIIKKMQDSIADRDTSVRKALREVATPQQRVRIKI